MYLTVTYMASLLSLAHTLSRSGRKIKFIIVLSWHNSLDIDFFFNKKKFLWIIELYKIYHKTRVSKKNNKKICTHTVIKTPAESSDL